MQEAVLRPVAADVAGERRAALRMKLSALARSCRDYLSVGLQAAERADADRERLRRAVLNESVNAAVIRDELRTAERRMHEGERPAFEGLLLPRRAELTRRLIEALGTELPTWHGNLAVQGRHYEAWMKLRLDAGLTPVSREASPLAADLLGRAEERLRRIVEAFRDRLSRNIRDATGLAVSPAEWAAERPLVTTVPVAVSRAFMFSWEMVSWLLPMGLVGGLFRRHVLGRVPLEVEKNLTRLVGDWTRAVNAAVTDLRRQAEAWVETELSTLDRLLGQQSPEASAFREAIRLLEEAAGRPS